MSYLEPVVSSEFPNPVIGERTGCLPRTSLLGADFPMASDRVDIIPRSLWPDYTDEHGLMPYSETTFYQKDNSCASEAIAQAIMIARSFAGLPHVVLNPLFIYGRVNGGRDKGSTLDGNLRWVMEHGCVPEEVWSREEGWRAEPPPRAYEAAMEFRIKEVFDVANINEMVSCLLKRFPVVHAAKLHAVCGVKHFDETKPTIKNSWGKKWGQDGFGFWASYRAIEISRYGAFAVRVAESGE